MITPEDHAVVRLITDDVELLLPALLQRGASLRLIGRERIEVRGMRAAEFARIAALQNARVVDLESV